MSPSTKPLAIAVLTTALVTALSYLLPDQYAATGVGLAFLAVTYGLVLRGDAARVRHFGMSMGGLLEPGAIRARRVTVDALRALGWACALALLVFPLFWVGFVSWWQPQHPFVWRAPASPFDAVLGQVFVIALPEEAFYRGYLQTALDDAWKKRVRILGAPVGWGLLVTSVLFALGHLATDLNPARLAVFFPSLLFGWLRARTGGIGASTSFHALSNLFSSTLGRGYGLFG